MRVAIYYNNNDVRLEEMSVPRIGPGEILMRVEASGICGSDVVEWYRTYKAPLVLGHEIAGEIVEIGRGIKDYKRGDRVTVAHHVPCNKCYYCMNGHHTACETLRKTNIVPGGFSEFVMVPAINVEQGGVFIIPSSLSYEEATFTEPIACVLRAFRKARFKAGQGVLVIGSGIAGLLSVHIARVLGAGLIMATDIVPYRIEAAKRFGADFSVDANSDVAGRFKEVNSGRLADLVIVCAGSEKAIIQALGCVERGGVILFFALTDSGVTIPISINDLFFRNDITLTTSYAGSPGDYGDALELISQKKIKVKDMITHKFGLSETQKGFQLVTRAMDSIKVIIEPQRL